MTRFITNGSWDHPRSRGVYFNYLRVSRFHHGSSPLARGLRRSGRRPTSRRRIIPARAGFTAGTVFRLIRDKDHPRSRGVYTSCTSQTCPESGSSPLARGLLIIKRRAISDGGIIPARAGFTSASPYYRSLQKDHPRSRGVYVTVNEDILRRAGSSPLARGLLIRVEIKYRQPGIIPARAGFTAPADRGTPTGPDHPRSRGVYGYAGQYFRTPGGSSPLARGLLPHGHGGLARRGIIPARAGFTRVGAHDASVRRDHPRSRGVYIGQWTQGRAYDGSSPLARGLQRQPRKILLKVRIIPARAGFTMSNNTYGAPLSDHPRSRGVYPSARRFRMRA